MTVINVGAYRPFTNTGIYNQCVLALPEAGDYAAREFEMHLTRYDNAAVNSTTVEVASGPMVDMNSSLGFGGNAIAYGVNQLPKLYFEGWFDTPYTVKSKADPMINLGINVGGQMVNVAQYIAAYFQGTAAVVQAHDTWSIVDPLWWRDPYGRQYTNPRVLTFTAERVEAVPYRHNFTMTLLIGRSTQGY